MAPEPPKPDFGATILKPYKIAQSPFYSHVASSTGPARIVITAGQVGTKPDGTVPSDIDEQVRQAISNLGRCLEAAGARVEDVLKLTYYIVDYSSANPRHRPALLEFLGNHRPGSTLVPVHALAQPAFKFEIEATAAIPQNPTERVDVVIVGAGLSGLQAAVDLHKAGLRVKVLEARDRVGGKTLSRPAQQSICDVGAAWINDTNQSRMYALAKRFNLDLITQNTTGRIIVDVGVGKLKTHPYGQLLSEADDKEAIDDVIRIRDLFESTCQKIDISRPVSSGQALRNDLDNITFEDWVRSHGPFQEDALNALKIGTRAM
jgi:monoamine oxidase